MIKAAFCICGNKESDADQLRGFRYLDSTIPLLPKSEISSLWPYSVIVQPGLCGTWSETPKTGFLLARLVSSKHIESEEEELFIVNYTKTSKLENHNRSTALERSVILNNFQLKAVKQDQKPCPQLMQWFAA